jgi:hypothetical protein
MKPSDDEKQNEGNCRDFSEPTQGGIKSIGHGYRPRTLTPKPCPLRIFSNIVLFKALFFMVFLDKKTLPKLLYFVRLNLGLGILGRQTFLGESGGVCFHFGRHLRATSLRASAGGVAIQFFWFWHFWIASLRSQ